MDRFEHPYLKIPENFLKFCFGGLVQSTRCPRAGKWKLAASSWAGPNFIEKIRHEYGLWAQNSPQAPHLLPSFPLPQSGKTKRETGQIPPISFFFFAFEIPRIWGKGVGGERAAAAKKKMASNFSFPPLTPEQIAEALHTYGLAPTANLRAEDIANPQPDLLPAVISNFLATVVDPTGCVRAPPPPPSRRRRPLGVCNCWVEILQRRRPRRAARIRRAGVARQPGAL